MMMNPRKVSELNLEPAAPPTVLVVEDEVLVRLSIADHLRDCGYRVIEAESADEAIAMLESEKTPVDIVFSDVNMPGQADGLGLARWLRRERPNVRVLLTSGVARAEAAAEALCMNGHLLEKPYRHEEVERRLRGLLTRAA